MAFCSNSLNGQARTRLWQSAHRAPCTPLPTLYLPRSLLAFLSPRHGPPRHSDPRLGCSLLLSFLFLSSSLSLLPSSLVPGTPGSNKAERGACCLMLSGPGNRAKHKTDTNAAPTTNPTLATPAALRGKGSAVQLLPSCCHSPSFPNDSFQYQRHSQLSK